MQSVFADLFNTIHEDAAAQGYDPLRMVPRADMLGVNDDNAGTVSHVYLDFEDAMHSLLCDLHPEIERLDIWEYPAGVSEIHKCILLAYCLKLTLDVPTKLGELHAVVNKSVKALQTAQDELKLMPLSRLGWSEGSLFEDSEILADSRGQLDTPTDLLREAHDSIKEGINRQKKLLNQLAPHAAATGRGRPPKFSTRFTIMRLAAIYEKHSSEKRGAGVSTIANPNAGEFGEPDFHQTGPFLQFVKTYLSAFGDRSEKSFTNNGLGRTIKDALAIRKRHGPIDELIHQNNTSEEMSHFCRYCLIS